MSSLSMEDLLKRLVSEKVDPNDQIFSYLCETDTKKLRYWLAKLEKVRAVKTTSKVDKGRKSNLTGRIFERLVRCLFDGCHAMRALPNVHTTTSEIDFLVEVLPLGKVVPFVDSCGTHLMGEAKCVLKGLKKEWVDELRGIMDTHGTRRGLLFTAVPPRKLMREPRVSIALHAAQDRLVIPFGLTQIAAVMDGENFLKILSRQAISASNHLSDLGV